MLHWIALVHHQIEETASHAVITLHSYDLSKKEMPTRKSINLQLVSIFQPFALWRWNKFYQPSCQRLFSSVASMLGTAGQGAMKRHPPIRVRFNRFQWCIGWFIKFSLFKGVDRRRIKVFNLPPWLLFTNPNLCSSEIQWSSPHCTTPFKATTVLPTLSWMPLQPIVGRWICRQCQCSGVLGQRPGLTMRIGSICIQPLDSWSAKTCLKP